MCSAVQSSVVIAVAIAIVCLVVALTVLTVITVLVVVHTTDDSVVDSFSVVSPFGLENGLKMVLSLTKVGRNVSVCHRAIVCPGATSEQSNPGC